MSNLENRSSIRKQTKRTKPKIIRQIQKHMICHINIVILYFEVPSPQNIDIDGTNGTITLVWSKPGETVLTIDKYKLDITEQVEDSIITTESVVLSAETFRYVIENTQHKIYYFKLYSGSNDCYSDSVERAYNGNRMYFCIYVLRILPR